MNTGVSMRQWSKLALYKKAGGFTFCDSPHAEARGSMSPTYVLSSTCFMLSLYKVLTPTLGFEPNHPQFTKGASPGVGCYLREES